MALTAVDLFYSGSGASSASGNPKFVALDSVTSTFVPLGVQALNNLAQVTKSVAWTGSGASSSGDVYDDKIIAEFACYFADTHYDTVNIDPETGKPMNRHWETALQLLNAKYGVVGTNGQIVPPLWILDEKAYGTPGRVDATSPDAHSDVPNL